MEGSFGNYVNSGVADSVSGAFTFIAAVRRSVAGTSAANYTAFGGTLTATGAGAKGFFLAAQASLLFTIAFVNGGTTAIDPIQVASRGLNLWEVVACTFDPAIGLNFYNLSTGVQAATVPPPAGAYAPNPASPVLLGSAPLVTASNYPSPADVAYAEMHNVALTLAECQAIYNVMKPVLANRGIAA
jgi:hypothetical protein